MEPSQGILVAQVNKGSPAGEAGLEGGDVIVEYDGHPVSDIGSFRNRVSLTPPGSHKRLTVIRHGKKLDILITIGQLTAGAAPSTEEQTSRAEAIGLTVQTLTPQLAERFGAVPLEGVVVTDVKPGSAAATAGIRPGVVILEVNRSPVTNVADFEREIAAASADKRVLLLVRVDGVQQYLSLNW
jgi:serine protease Do